jgi:hypothetical protein
MREIRQSGSEGGEAEINRPSLPLSLRCERSPRWMFRGGEMRLMILMVKCVVAMRMTMNQNYFSNSDAPR